MPIRIFSFTGQYAHAIEQFATVRASSVELAHGNGESHAYAVHIEAGGAIGPHPAGYDQLFLAAVGSGWVAGRDGVRQALPPGCGAFIPKGEIHCKGSEVGLLAIMVQATTFALFAPGV